MGALVGTLLCGYTIAKVLRDALFLAEFGALALPYAYVGVAVVSAAFVWLESRVVRRYTRTFAARLNQQVAILACIVAAFTYPHATRPVSVLFYLWTGSQAMMLLPHFWVLALDLWDSRRARRVFPLLSGCGLIGGIVGGAIPGWLTPLVHRDGLMWVLVALLALAHGLTLVIDRHVGQNPRAATPETASSRWDILRRSKYLQIFAAVLALSVIVSTLVDFQFKYVVQQIYHDRHALTAFLGKFYVGLNVLALLFQFVLAGWMLQRLGLGTSTGLQPSAVLVLATWTAVSGTWWIIVAMRWVQGVMFQTLGKSSAEIYYAAVRPSERRAIKPAIDMLVERWGDALVGVVLIVVLGSLHVPIATIAVVTSVLAAAWLALLVVLDRQYGRAFHQALSSRWIEPDVANEALRCAGRASRARPRARIRRRARRPAGRGARRREHATAACREPCARACEVRPPPCAPPR
jgi:ATP/ADP translocase